jgi:hypothetical protein
VCVLLGVMQDDAVPAIVVIHPLAEHLLESVLSKIGDAVEYLIEKGRISRLSSLASGLQTWQVEPMNGSSIGSQTEKKHWGSLGGYLKLRNGSVVAMTCGHVLRGNDESDLTTVCIQPSKHHLKVHYDGTDALIPNINLDDACVKRELCQRRNDLMLEASRQRTRCQCFGEVQHIEGQVPIFVGTREISLLGAQAAEYRDVTMSMDWAILMNLTRTAKQNLIHNRVVQGWKKVTYTVENGTILVGNCQRVYMQGARSGQSQGTLSPQLVECHFEDNDRPTVEIGILGYDDEPFSNPGDSGSWVIEKEEMGKASVIGVLIGGYYDGIGLISLMTPMEHLLKDISTTLKMKEGTDWCSWL